MRHLSDDDLRRFPPAESATLNMPMATRAHAYVA